MMHEFEFDIGGWFTRDGATRVCVVLDPVRSRVYSFNAIGSGTPMEVYTRKHRVLTRVPVNTVPSSLLAALLSRVAEIRRIAAQWQGEEWDGHNFIGTWADADEWEEIALEDDDVAKYFDAADWCAGDPGAVVSETLAAHNLDEAVDRQIAHAYSMKVHLEARDVRRVILELLEGYRETLDPVDSEDRAKERVLSTFLDVAAFKAP
jgi:hypothetical protein